MGRGDVSIRPSPARMRRDRPAEEDRPAWFVEGPRPPTVPPARARRSAGADGDPASRSRGPVVRVAASRCPWCHGAVAVEADDWAACRRCLARQHEGCWGEGGRCGACGGRERLTPASSDQGRAAPAAGARAAAQALRLLVAVLVASVLGLGLAAALQPERDAEAAPALGTHRSAPVEPEPVPDFVWERLAFLENEGRLRDAAEWVEAKHRDYPNPELLAVAARIRRELRR